MAKSLKQAVRIEVTQAMIKGGIRLSLTRCPIALAFRKATSINGADVVTDAIDFRCKLKLYVIALPKKAQTFIQKFDGCSPVKPFTFVLKIPEEALKKAG